MKIETNEYIIQLRIGSNLEFGHGKSVTFLFKSNKPEHDIIDAYNKGTEILGFDLIKEVCDDYNSSRMFTISAKHSKRLDELGFDMNLMGIYDQEVEWHTDAHVEAFIFIVKLGDADIQFEEFKVDGDIYIGGFGLL